MNKFLCISALVLSLLGGKIFAGSCACGGNIQSMLETLKIETAQKERIKPILEKLKSNIKGSSSQMNALDTKIEEQVNSATMDEPKTRALIDEKSKLIGDMIQAKAVAKNQIFAILNPQQKTEFQNMIKTREDKIATEFKSCHSHADEL